MSAPKLHGHHGGGFKPHRLEPLPAAGAQPRQQQQQHPPQLGDHVDASTTVLPPPHGRPPHRISGIAILLPMAAVFAVVVLVHLPNQRAMERTLQHTNEGSIRMLALAPFAAVVQTTEYMGVEVSTIAAASRSSNIDLSTAQVLGIEDSSNATLSVPDDEVMQRMLNGSLRWDRWWIRWLTTLAARTPLVGGVPYTAEYIRRDGLCIGLLDSVHNVLYRGNCSSCSLVFAQWSSPQTLSNGMGALPLQLSNWTTNFSTFEKRFRCSLIDGRVVCASSRYFQNPPGSWKDAVEGYFAAPAFLLSASRSCFGTFDTLFRSPVRGGVASGYNDSVLGVFTLSLDATYLSATTELNMPSIFVGDGWRVFPIKKAPSSLLNVTRASSDAICIDDALDTVCFPTKATVQAFWPVMYAAAVAAEGALAEMSAGETTRTLWADDGQGERIFVVATASSMPAGFYVRYATQHEMNGHLTAALDRSRTTSIGISAALFAVALCMMAATLLLLRAATYELRNACAHNLQQALADRLRTLPAQHQSAGVTVDSTAPTYRGEQSMTKRSLPCDQSAMGQPSGGSTMGAAFNRSASSRNRLKVNRKHQQQQQRGSSVENTSFVSMPKLSNPVDTSAVEETSAYVISWMGHERSRRGAPQLQDKDGVDSTSSIDRAIANLNARLLRWGKTFKEPRLLLDATDAFAQSIHSVIAFVSAGALVTLQAKEAAQQHQRRLEEVTSRWWAPLDCASLWCGNGDEIVVREESSYAHRPEASTSSVVPPVMARDGRELSATLWSPVRSTGRPPLQQNPVVMANRELNSSNNVPRRGKNHAGHVQAHSDDSELSFTLGDVPQLPPASSSMPAEPASTTSAFVIFDLGWCSLDEPVVAREYMRMMDMVVSMFGRFGGFVDRVEASTVVASFNLHLPCKDYCDCAVRCAASLLRAMEEKLKIWSLDEESISLRTLGTEFVIAVDAGTASLENFSFMRKTPRSQRLTKIRSVVVKSETVVRMQALVPFLRGQQLVCTATSCVLHNGDVSVPLVVADSVTWDGWRRDAKTIVLLDVETSDVADLMKLQVESKVVEQAIVRMERGDYEAALDALAQYTWDDCGAVARMQGIAQSQLELRSHARVPYHATYSTQRSWRLHDDGNVVADEK